MGLFENLKHLTIVASSVNDYPPLSLSYLPPTTYFSPTLTVLCVNVYSMNDCLSLLDGRLNKLSTFIVNIDTMWHTDLISHNMVSWYYFIDF